MLVEGSSGTAPTLAVTSAGSEGTWQFEVARVGRVHSATSLNEKCKKHEFYPMTHFPPLKNHLNKYIQVPQKGQVFISCINQPTIVHGNLRYPPQ